MKLAKLLASRLTQILAKIVSPLQNNFVPKKKIHDNFLTAHEILSKGKRYLAI